MMNIAVVLSNVLTQGGGFQQELSTITILNKKKGYYNFQFFTTKKENITLLKKNGINVKLLYNNSFLKLLDLFLGNNLMIFIRRKLMIIKRNFLDKKFDKFDIDLVYFLSPCEEVILLENHNFIITVWDLCHRDNPEFPEVAHFRRFETRELLYLRGLPKAFKILADSDIGAFNIVRRYNIDTNRVISIPFIPSGSVLNHKFSSKKNDYVIKKYNLPNNYLFYPAQFWPHKNHSFILDGLKILKEKYRSEVFAVFCGSNRGNLDFILEKSKTIGVSDLIINLGFVENDEIPYLYINSIALAMPTYFGPTNLPTLEAFTLGCPVLYSDLPDLKQHVKGAAFLLDLTNPECLAIHVKKILNNENIVKEKITNGYELVKDLTPDNYWKKVEQIFEEYKRISESWKYYS